MDSPTQESTWMQSIRMNCFYDGLASYEQEIINEENVLCKTHLNLSLIHIYIGVYEKVGMS